MTSKMYSNMVFTFIGVAFGASNAAATAASNLMRFIPGETEAMQQDAIVLEQPTTNSQNHGRISTLHRRALVLVSLATALAVIFLALHCFSAHSSAHTRRRRLATGGGSDNGNGDPCEEKKDEEEEKKKKEEEEKKREEARQALLAEWEKDEEIKSLLEAFEDDKKDWPWSGPFWGPGNPEWAKNPEDPDTQEPLTPDIGGPAMDMMMGLIRKIREQQPWYPTYREKELEREKRLVEQREARGVDDEESSGEEDENNENNENNEEEDDENNDGRPPWSSGDEESSGANDSENDWDKDEEEGATGTTEEKATEDKTEDKEKTE